MAVVDDDKASDGQVLDPSSDGETLLINAYREENPLFYRKLVELMGKQAADETVWEAVCETLKQGGPYINQIHLITDLLG